MVGDSYNTNLAAEFYVLSMLHRLGAEANLTLGNKKSVDIAVIRGEGDSVTIDVKGLAGKTAWPVDNLGEPSDRHFIVFICFLGKIKEPHVAPEAWVIPSTTVKSFVYEAPRGRRVVQRSKLKAEAERFKDAWSLVTETPVPESHLALAEERLANYRRDPSRARPAHDVLDRLANR